MKTISLEPQVTTDRAKTMQGKTEEITPKSRKTDKFVPSTEKETMLAELFTSFPETHSAQPGDDDHTDEDILANVKI